ncbi:MAG: radical SAM protein [Gemmatimonadales bacterium]
MLLGFAITEHCNLRCPHCIRDDVTTVRSLEPALIERTVDDALAIFGDITVSMTGGEPLLHPELERLLAIYADRKIPWRMVTNAWHIRREMPLLDKYPPQAMRLSLSGGTEAGHDHDRGTGSFKRVLIGAALLTSRQIPFWFSMVVDRRVRGELRAAADLAESMGAFGLSVILPQPTPGAAARNSDLSPAEWFEVAAEARALGADPARKSRVVLDYGAPFEGPESPCQTFAEERVYVDTRGRLCLCCQLSNHGFNEAEVVADLHVTPFAEGWPLYRKKLAALRAAQAPDPARPSPTDPFPCLRCVKAQKKDRWVDQFPQSAWHPGNLGAGVRA